ncbi:magnesium chelatase subunit H [Bradyrhizobium ontarionense]|uniref:magnesium chelatase n=1 Tax=Bradyrhizobium ontarionense TaxID=2898149 RepID=A0ABY3RLL4_9BRAD|nr:magnesium chelatase subunit H [Bradyrhizobium sp. A19]UFZ07687.1 magnesium chelatase subunit H [Bradyrhizobium sp. A19]
MPKRISVADNTPIRVVIVTMDSHLASAALRARAALQAELPGLDLKVHAADEWGCHPDALQRCNDDIATGDIIVATMLFMEDHIQPVLPALTARRDHCDAMIGCLSAGEVVRLTRLGKLTMSGSATGVLGLLKRLRGSSRPGGAASGQGQMKMLQRMPRLLRYIPGTAQDLRAYFLTLQYWLAGSEQNFANMVRYLVGRYADGSRASLRGKLNAAEPVTYPDVGLYHPRLAQRIIDRADELPAVPKAVGRVGVILMRSYLLAANTAHYDGVISSLEARGLAVVPVFACGLDSRPAIERYFQKDGVATVDAVVSLTGFSLVGGPAYNDARAAEEVMASLDVPLIAAHPLEFQTVEQWHDDARGLTPVEATMMVAIPELDGAVGPTVFGGRSSMGDAGRDMASLPERAAQLAARVGKLVELRRSARASRRLAVVLFNFPPNGGAAGTAAYLSVFESLHNVMNSLRAAGYTIDVPATVDELRARVLKGNAERFGTAANVAARIPVDQHVRRERHLAEIEKQWGPAPGRHQTDGASLLVLGEQFGNVFVGLQPAFGYEGDPMRLLFERSFAPTHAFAAFYRWMREDFRAHAVLHFGTHGALEFMPGKQAGLSAECWPERLIGDLPNFYIYASNNPSEGALAKRRGGATLISYLTPSITRAGLYKGLADLKSSLDAWRNLSPDATAQVRADSVALIQAQAAAVDLASAEPAWDGERDARIAALATSVLELEYSLIPHGLHVVGASPPEAQRNELLELAGIADAAKRAELDRLLATDSETPAILHALDGGYIRPVPGGDLLRNTDVLPTGRNLHGFDPFRIPSAFALKDAERQVARLLARHAGEGHGLPETIALVLWGTDNLKTEGGPIAQALWLMGAEPRHDSYGRLCGANLIPLERLGRPRIDVVITLSGIFRDLMPLQTKLLAEAALLAAAADEPAEMNYVRKHALAFQAAHGGELADAALRVFGNAEGAYGANVNQLIDCGAWTDEDELADVYTRRKGFAYGTDGRPVRRDALLGHVLAGVDAAYQNVDSVELGVTTIDHYFDTLGGISRAVRRAKGEAAPVYIGDQTRGEGTVRTLSEQVALETRTRTLNPKWYEALLAHGYEGVRQIESHVTNTMGWSATTGQVAPWVYQQITTTFVLDEAMRERLASLNPAASAKIANRLIEAHERNYWTPDPAMLDVLRKAGEELEDRLEGVGVAA